MENLKANSLIHQSSPYLLQHAYNPVNWQVYSEKAFLEAEANDKLVIISIGYSTCHWCHVMEHESFEDLQVAELMNEHFINIKIDREERPDIDAVYMHAVQLMTGKGGWPLNVVVLPDKRAIYGGTYFPKNKWMEILQNLQKIWESDRAQVYTYAENLLAGMNQTALLLDNNAEGLNAENALLKSIKNDEAFRDLTNGGADRAPKFPMPVNYLFRLHYAHILNDTLLQEHLNKTLLFMALGGIYDQVGGGFFRYSTDAFWKVPHFEKMLYDNAQLLQLYAKANRFQPHPEYKKVCEGIYNWLKTEMKDPNGGYYAALDADSEGEEGKFYIFTKTELQQILGPEYEIAAQLYEINPEGYWENNHYILLRSELNPNTQFTTKYHNTLESINEKIKAYRSLRIRPSTDKKILCSWNALLVSGLVEYFKTSQLNEVKVEAEKLIEFLLENFYKNEKVYRTIDSNILGTLEDYSTLCSACIDIASIVDNPEHYLQKAKELCLLIESSFNKEHQSFLSSATMDTTDLLMDMYEVQDNVIPSGNAIHALNKYKLAFLLGKPEWENEVQSLLNNILGSLIKFPTAYSKWLDILLLQTHNYNQVVISGPEATQKALNEYTKIQINGDLFCLNQTSDLPIFANRFQANQHQKFSCYGHECQLPENI